MIEPKGQPTHPSLGWKAREFERLRGSEAAHRDRFAELMRLEQFPTASQYDPAWVWGNHMGPNVLWLTDWLLQAIDLQPRMRVLDLGCGPGASSMFLAHERDVEVWAADLWIPPHHNLRRFREAGFEAVYPIHAEARALPFQQSFFDAIVSVDSYHYFGLDPAYVRYLAGFVKPGGVIGVVVPGNDADTGVEWNGEVIDTFRSASWWAELWGDAADCVTVESANMLDDGWQTWWRFAEAADAWVGDAGDPSSDADRAMLLENRGLGFARVIARVLG